MITSLKRKLFLKQLGKLKTHSYQTPTNQINTLSSFTILATSAHCQIRDLSEAVTKLKKLGLEGGAFFAPDRSEDVTLQPYTEIINKEDYNWYNIPTQDFLVKWLSVSSDLLIVINPDHSPLLRYLCAASNCRLKAAIDFGYERDEAIDFYLTLKDAGRRAPYDLSLALIKELQRIGRYES